MNGSTLTLGIVGALAAAGAPSRRGSAAWAGNGYGGTLRPTVYGPGEGAKVVAAGGVLHGWDRYAQLVSEAYMRAPKRTLEGERAFRSLESHIVSMFKRIESKVRVEFTEQDPYASAQQMNRQIRRTGTLKVYAGDNQPQAWSDPEVNLMFRAVHDYAAHLGSMGRGDIRHFTYKGELQAYNKHLNLIGPSSPGAAALFTEVVGQVSHYWHTGEFEGQKVVLMPQFNHARLGEVRGYKISDGDLVPA